MTYSWMIQTLKSTNQRPNEGHKSVCSKLLGGCVKPLNSANEADSVNVFLPPVGKDEYSIKQDADVWRMDRGAMNRSAVKEYIGKCEG